jgi:chromosome segregation ATPase
MEKRITEMQGCDHNTCILHDDILGRIMDLESRTNDRVSKLEGDISDIHQQLRKQAENTASVKTSIDAVLMQQTGISSDVKELRTNMMDLVTTTLQQSRTDMSTWMQMTEKHRQDQESKDKVNQAKSEEKDKSFYRKLILACVSILGTIVLSFFGIKALIPLFAR